MDDVLIFGATQAEHDHHLTAALNRLEEAGVTLNPSKCKFGCSCVSFLGHIVDKSGIRADPSKTSAILQMEPPRNVPELRRFLGMANQLGKFSPHLAEISQPLRELLSTRRSWTWGPDQQAAFTQVQKELSQPTVLALYDPKAPTKVSADASSFGLGAVLLQQFDDQWKPVAYASRSMTETERRYAQIEKEALAATWACERFSNYILGREFQIESDHKPLIPLLTSKALDNLPPRVLRFRLRLARFNYTAIHVPGKLLFTADALSRAPVMATSVDIDSMALQQEVETFIESVTSTLPATQKRLEEYKQSQTQDATCSQVLKYCQTNWPERGQVSGDLVPYWKVRASLSVCNNLLLYNDRIVVPLLLQNETLQRLHEGHQGIQRCKLRAKTSVWWPGISRQMEQMIQNCHTCAKEVNYRKEPLMPTELTEFPWQVVGSDLFELRGVHYLLIVDYFSRFPEVVKISTTTSTAIIAAMKPIFSRHGFPEVLRSDNGPQYASLEMAEFLSSNNIQHATSSPHYPQSNGMAERFVQTVKRLLKQCEDLNLALLTYRATPLPWCNRSPAELLMGRCIRTSLPQTDKQLTPQWPYLEKFRKSDQALKMRQKKDFDRHHRVHELPDIPDNTNVWVTSGETPIQGQVQSSAGAPRSYIVETPTGSVRRNRSQLRAVPDVPHLTITESTTPEPNRVMTRIRTGTQVHPPDRLNL